MFNKLIKSLFVFSTSLSVTINLFSQDTINKPGLLGGGIKKYDEVIPTSAKTKKGLLIIHNVNNKWFFEISDNLFEKDILIVSRITKASAAVRASNEMIGYAGDQIGENVVRFSKGPNQKIFLKLVSYREISIDSSENGMFRSVLNSNLQPIVAAFDIRAYSSDSLNVVVDMSSFLSSDNELLGFSSSSKSSLGISSLQQDKSYIKDVKSFTENIEISSVRTFSKATGPGAATYEINNSFILLPDKPMDVRYFDSRVGYFSSTFVDFDVNPQKVENTSIIRRWRLEPRDEDIPRYLAGELVQPKKPIVFYIDPSTPKKWVPYLIQGVNDWQIAFERAGFKNAICAKEAPSFEEDSLWSLEDARHSAIVYKPSAIENASGPNIADPRTGEILEAHVNWYHNIMKLLHDWYFIQTSAVNPKARSMQYDDQLMGRLLRYVASHEVGHSLGLLHNFGASSSVPVDSLRNNKYLEKNGLCPSIMDYSRFNYVAQPGDNIVDSNLLPKIGSYDIWAIEWGYRWFPKFNTISEEKKFMNNWIIDVVGKNKNLAFGTETDIHNPNNQSEDIGDNSMKAGYYGIQNLKTILPNLIEWTKEPSKDFESLAEMYSKLTDQFNRYLVHVAKNIGGIISNPKTSEENGDVITFVPRSKQKQAIRFLHDQLFITPKWLINDSIFALTRKGGFTQILYIQKRMIERIVSHGTFAKMLYFEEYNPNDSYAISDYINDLKNAIFTELKSKQKISFYRRNLQKVYVEQMVSLISSDPSKSTNFADVQWGATNKFTDVLSVIKQGLRTLISEIKMVLPYSTDKLSKAHLLDIKDRIEEALFKPH